VVKDVDVFMDIYGVGSSKFIDFRIE